MIDTHEIDGLLVERAKRWSLVQLDLLDRLACCLFDCNAQFQPDFYGSSCMTVDMKVLYLGPRRNNECVRN